ncbi:hypothetical protein BASA50_001018 [Batrachochytrium salamandrivorans]|uniref:Vta1/callose synthase N-terminal domain-containing protein n=1 Tax=Batrachochytrium salamandrivorans TaxID=1357716 RepID=A0ABQ8ET43_9FUNG|nr:hypothetical protein BASA50_001018 [Batrachochytrium salamandrivorans]KAH9248980.1 hypothetical protein BASA81_013324 [Batrachochytrium salamandrivorans]
MNPPEELKFVATFLQRGQELREREPIIAYYCNYYSAKLAIEKGATSKESQIFLLNLLDALEQDKVNLAGNEAIGNDVVGYAHVENFALRIFINADNEDRAGRASKKTAKTFLAASIFLELLKTFGALDSEVQQKIRYAKFKAADIIKALKEGRVPVAGPPGGEQMASEDNALDGANTLPTSEHQISPIESSVPTDLQSMSITPTLPLSDAISRPQSFLPAPIRFDYASSSQDPVQTPHSAQSHSTTFTPSSLAPPLPLPQPYLRPNHQSVPYPPPATTPDYDSNATILFDEQASKVMAQAQRHSKFAISALQFEDVPTAIDNLQKALALLQPLARPT